MREYICMVIIQSVKFRYCRFSEILVAVFIKFKCIRPFTTRQKIAPTATRECICIIIIRFVKFSCRRFSETIVAVFTKFKCIWPFIVRQESDTRIHLE